MSQATPTAAWSAPALVRALGNAGWGDLHGRAGGGVRGVLQALSRLLPSDAAEGRLTAAQVADSAGLSVRWTRHVLHALEDAGLVIWHRGWIDQGRPRPGWIRLVKTALADLIRAARDQLHTRLKARQRTTATRLAGLRKLRIPPTKRRNPLSQRAELSSPLPCKGRRAGAPNGPPLPLDNTEGAPMPMCRTCGLPPEGCDRTQKRLPFKLRHDYDAAASPFALVADLRPEPGHGPRPGWRAQARPAHPAPAQLPLEEGQR